MVNETPSNFQKPKKKPWAGIILLIILLVLGGIAVSWFLADKEILAECEVADDCKVFNVNYISGQGYVCADADRETDESFKTKILMFRYARENAVLEKPSGCLCINNSCKIVE